MYHMQIDNLMRSCTAEVPLTNEPIATVILESG